MIGSIKPFDFIASLREWQESDPAKHYDLASRANRHDSVSGNEIRTMYRGGGDSVVSMDDGKLEVEITSHSEVQRSEILRAILRRFSIPHDEWTDIEQETSSQVMKTISESHSIQSRVSLNLPAASRAMVKSMLALACYVGVNRTEFRGSLAHWREGNNRYLGDIPDWEVLPLEDRIDKRCVAISGSAKTGILFGFVDFNGSLPWIMPLIAPYEGPPRHAVYAIDTKTGDEVNVSPNMERPRAEAVAMETAACLAAMTSSVEGMSSEEVASLAALGQVPTEGELRSIADLFAPGLRGNYNLSRESFNEEFRLPLGLPPVGEDGLSC